ncbi:MAG: thioredoxin domain-containing protein [Candidatus Paceibacterota bacterium]|jgi:thiol-disulfide isomerase/thioredoxin
MSNNVKIFIAVIILLILGTVASVLVQSGGMPVGPGKYDALATCLKDKGAVFYGAFWCPHCQATKKEFGSAAKLLPYVECSTSDAAGQLQICADKKIDSYPTWEFADGSRLTGEVSLSQLADKTACVLPQ